MTQEVNERKLVLLDSLMMLAVFAFLFCYFEPNSLFSKTITTGGDTASHYYTARYLIDDLLPKGRITGWCQGNLAGFPMLQNYFPLPFLAIWVFSWIMPLQIAFKLGTVLGTFLLPPCTYAFFRLIRQPFPVPIIGAIFSLAFLFMEGNTMWGGNIPSTLAGPFCYSLGFSLLILWLGLLYRAMCGYGGIRYCAIVLALVGMCHGYTLLVALFSSLYFLLNRRKFRSNLKKLLLIHSLAFCLMGFWLVPLIAFLPWTTRFNVIWIFFNWGQIQREIFPVIILPFAGITVTITIWKLVMMLTRRKFSLPDHWAYVWFIILGSLFLFTIGYRIGLPDIRFLPSFQFFLVIGAALAWPRISNAGTQKLLAVAAVLLLTLLWVDSRETICRNWARSNYAGFESKTLWKPFKAVNRFLKGDVKDPRVVYEHSIRHQGAGTVRAFENLPLFSGRSTLEGVYIQASLSVPFIFYLQSEMSQNPSTPIADYNYSRFNLKKAHEHLKLFNVSEVVLVEPETIRAANASPGFDVVYRAAPYQVYRVNGNSGHYVVPLKYKPIATSTGKWRKLSYKWFRLGDLSIPLVFKDNLDQKDFSRFHVLKSPHVKAPPKIPLDDMPPIREVLKEDEILIENASVGKPLLIKVSYHPNWKVEGADRIYLTSPAFMLIYPQKSRVRLFYGRTWPDYLGALLTVMTILSLLLYPKTDAFRKRLSKAFDRYAYKAICFCMGLLTMMIIYFLARLAPQFPVLPYNKGIKAFGEEDYGVARGYFQKVMEEFPQTVIVDQAAYQYAMSYYREKDWKLTIFWLNWLLETYPETRRAAEVYYHMGLCYLNQGKTEQARVWFQKTVNRFPGTNWAGFAKDRLQGMPAS
ncbi:tetratricopeptide repeat protein [delta proteobacterium NaphS2]|nr:tetratricopeptide repeat protein [delta proteobacterium NaphS2]